MQHFPNLSLLQITVEQKQQLLKLALLVDDTFNNISDITDFNFGNLQTQQLVNIGTNITENLVSEQAPLEKKVEAYTIQQLYGLEFQTDNLVQNQFVNQNIKEQLIRKIDQSILISLQDKERWIKILNGDIEYQSILKIQKEFEQAEQKNNTDIIVKKVIVQSCKFITSRYLNGKFQVGDTKLPDMHGMQDDFIKFYMSSQVQDFFIQTSFGSKIRKSASNPVVQLTIDLINRGITNNISM